MVSAWKDSTYYLSASGPALQSPASSVPGHSCVDKKIDLSTRVFSKCSGNTDGGATLPGHQRIIQRGGDFF